MKDNSVKISTVAKIQDDDGNVTQEIPSGDVTLTYQEPESVDEAISLIGEKDTLDIVKSEWRTRFANGARAKLRDLLTDGLDAESAAEEVARIFDGWNPTVSIGGRGADPETVLRQKLASMSPEDAIAWLQEQQAALAATAE